MEYANWSYEDLSSVANRLRLRAFELIPLMYNRLTKVEALSDKETKSRIRNDHKHLPGFSKRNIRGYLPIFNDSVPHRIRLSRPKNSSTKRKASDELSDTTLEHPIVDELIHEKVRLICENIYLNMKSKLLEECLIKLL